MTDEELRQIALSPKLEDVVPLVRELQKLREVFGKLGATTLNTLEDLTLCPKCIGENARLISRFNENVVKIAAAIEAEATS